MHVESMLLVLHLHMCNLSPKLAYATIHVANESWTTLQCVTSILLWDCESMHTSK